MDKTVPLPAAGLLDFIASFEAPKGYDTVYANRMSQMPKPLTSMTLAEVIADGSRRTTLFGSSACGRYQFMKATLIGLRDELGLTGSERFTPDLQDRLGYHLLVRRGYPRFISGAIGPVAFGLAIAQEWASFPVLANRQGAHRAVTRGQSYYAGDGLNKALVKPEAVEVALSQALLAASLVATVTPPPVVVAVVEPKPLPAPPAAVEPPPVVADTRTVWQRMADRLRAAFPPTKKA
jgi:muramidase (phage lysozyme)